MNVPLQLELEEPAERHQETGIHPLSKTGAASPNSGLSREG